MGKAIAQPLTVTGPGLAWLLPTLPVASALLVLALGHRRARAAAWLATGSVAVTALAGAAVLSQLLRLPPDARALVVRLGPWLDVGGLQVDWALLVDPLSTVMVVLVTGVGLLVHLYSIGYMRDDPAVHRYFAYLNLFVAAMLLLVLGESLAVLFVGWELVGATSYLLVGFWSDRPGAGGAALKAFVVNRVGDVGFVIAMLVTFSALGTLSLPELLADVDTLAPSTAVAIAALLFVGVSAKSAQLPLQVWLPDAMAGPTPVSALLHAATMVTAGVFLLARLSPLYATVPELGLAIAWIGTLSALLAALAACAQRDIKRVLAYSTISQLGYMVMAAGLGDPTAGLFHLLVQGAVKALLFLVAGAVMHALDGETDLDRMGGLWRRMPVTAAAGLSGAVALAGIPPLSGFWSKEGILLAALDTPGGRGMWVIGLLTGIITAFYIGRWFLLTFVGAPRWAANTARPHDPPATMRIPLLTLTIAALVVGAINLPGSALLRRWVAPALTTFVGEEPWFGHTLALWAAALAAAGGLLLAWWAYGRATPGALPRPLPASWARLAAAGFGVDDAYDRTLARPGRKLARQLVRFDERIVDGAVDGLAGSVRATAQVMRRLQTGRVRDAVAVMVAGLLGLVLWLLASTTPW